MNDGANFVPFYPWSEGDRLYASALNAAIANSVALGGDNKNFRTPYDFGAQGVVGGVPTDDTAALNIAFAQLGAEGGGRIYIPDTFYAAGALTVPPNVEIYGNFATSSQQWTPAVSYFQVGGSKLILGPSGISLGKSCILRNIMVIAHGLPASNPTTPAAAAALIATMPASGTGITLAGDNCLLDTVQPLGFNYGIYASGDPGTDRQMLRNIHADCINGISLGTGGDMCHIIGAHIWPYLTAMVGGGAGSAWLQRSGDGIYTKANGGSIQIAQSTVFGWQRCYVADTNSVTWTQCWADGYAPQSAGFVSTGACGILQLTGCTSVANQFGVHHSPSNGAVFNIDAGCSLQGGGPGGSTPATGMSCGVCADGHGPVQCIGAYFNGGDAAFYLGPNSQASVIVGNVFDIALDSFGCIWNVDPAVIPVLTKHSNTVINSSHGVSELFPVNPATGASLYDSMQNYITGFNLAGPMKMFADVGTSITPSFIWTAGGSATDEHVWDMFAAPTGFSFRMLDDANTLSNSWLTVTRSGYSPGTITLAASGIELTGAVGFNGTSPLPKPTVGGAKGGNTALASVLNALVAYGLITDSSSA